MTFGVSYLTQPDLFPARPAGAAWGNVDATIAFAGRRYQVRGIAPGQLARVAERFGPLLGGAGGSEAPVPLDIFRAPAEEFLHDRPRLWEVTFDLDPQPHAVRVAGLRFVARLDWRPRLGAALWTCVGDDDELPMVFENFFRLVAAYDLAGAGGALVHSAAVEVGGGALVFYGPSGAGKSTIAERALEAGLRVLSDDLNAVAVGERSVHDQEKAHEETARVEKVPFAGTHGGGPEAMAPLPLRALCRLRKGAVPAATRIGPAAALAGLFAASPFVNADPYRGPALEASLLALIGVAPTLDLTFSRDTPFAEIERAVAPWLSAPVRGGSGGRT